MKSLFAKTFILLGLILTVAAKSSSQIPYLFNNFPVIYDTMNGSPNHSEGLPIVADFKGDGSREIAVGCSVFGSGTPRMYLLDLNGNTLPGWPRYFNPIGYSFYILSTAAADINHDGKVELVVQTKDSIFVIDYLGRNLSGFPIYFPLQYDASFGLGIYDLENSGQLNIIASGDNKIAVYNNNGTMKPGWPRKISAPNIFRHLCICDLNGDGKGEILTTSFCGYGIGCNNNYIYAFDRNGNNCPGWPVFSDSLYVLGNGALIADPDRNNPSNTSLIVSSSIVIPGFSDSVHNRITVYNTNGTIRNRMYYMEDYFYTPIKADLLRDGNKEIFVGEQSHHDYLFLMNGLVGSGWPQRGSDAFWWQSCIGKLTYNNELCAITPLQQAFYDSQNVVRGRLYAYNYFGDSIPYWPLKPICLIAGTTCYDINNDGSVEILMTGNGGDHSVLNIYTIPGIPFTAENFPWPMYAHDRYRTNQLGFVPPDEPIGIKPISELIPGKFALYDNYPNPFNPDTRIKYDIPIRSMVSLVIYDVLGREVSVLVNEILNAGTYQVNFNGLDLASGIYFYRLTAGDRFTEVKKMVLVK